MKEVIISRKELYDLVWSKPVSTILKTYFLTDSGFRKICSELEVPLPKSGHWQKIKSGKKPIILPLLTEYKGETEVKLMQKEEGEEGLVPMSPLEALQKEIESDPNLTLTVPQKLTNPDKLISIAKDILTHQEVNRGHFYGMVFSFKNSVDIRVSPKNVGRALRFMDTFVKAIRARGHELVNHGTYATVFDEKIQITLREKTRREMVKTGTWERTEMVPTGVLSVQMGKYSYKKFEIMDGKQLIEDQLSKILAKLEMEGKKQHEERLAREKYRAEQEEIKRVKLELKERKGQELSDFMELFPKANRWHQTIILRKYIDEVEVQAKAKDKVSEELQAWFVWARKKVDWYDPFIELEDELLNDVDRDSIDKNNKSTTQIYW